MFDAILVFIITRLEVMIPIYLLICLWLWASWIKTGERVKRRKEAIQELISTGKQFTIRINGEETIVNVLTAPKIFKASNGEEIWYKEIIKEGIKIESI